MLNDLPAFLVFIYFLNATDVSGPRTVAEWEGAIHAMYAALGLSGKHALSEFVGNVFIDVRSLANEAAGGSQQ